MVGTIVVCEKEVASLVGTRSFWYGERRKRVSKKEETNKHDLTVLKDYRLCSNPPLSTIFAVLLLYDNFTIRNVYITKTVVPLF